MTPEVVIFVETEVVSDDGGLDTVVETETEQEVVVSSQTDVVVQEIGTDTVVEYVITQEVTDKGTQGPPGPPGPAGSIAYTGLAAEAIGGHRAIIQTTAGLMYADASAATHSGRVVGVTTSAANAGDQITYQSAGRIVEPSWSWTPGDDIYVGLDGALTQSIPFGAAFVQRAGYAIDATTMWVDLSEPVSL